MNDYSHNWFLNYLNTSQKNTCFNCKFANEYIAYWWYPYLDPTCSKGNSMGKNKLACLEFELIGRMSR